VPQITRRINRELVTHVDLELARQFHAEHRRLSLEIEHAFFYELFQRHDFFLLGRIDAANEGRESVILELDDHGTLDVGRGPDHPGCVANLHSEIAPIAQNVLSGDKNMRVEIDHLLSQLAIESGHHGDDENENG